MTTPAQYRWLNDRLNTRVCVLDPFDSDTIDEFVVGILLEWEQGQATIKAVHSFNSEEQRDTIQGVFVWPIEKICGLPKV